MIGLIEVTEKGVIVPFSGRECLNALAKQEVAWRQLAVQLGEQ